MMINKAVKPTACDGLSRFILISSKQIPRIHFACNIIQAAIIAVGNDGLAAVFEFFKVIHNFAAEEGRTILQSRLVNNDCRAFSLDTLHNALNRGLAEVIGVRLHGQAIYANHTRLLLRFVVLIVLAISIIACHTAQEKILQVFLLCQSIVRQ